ncbi:hypothetical protein [Aquimarina algicola]|uniref:DUF4179 domain-containing protein n=1 Tax=Aquimarina algicola TaxID=2589995 RepID=A0A504JMT0_9FLAO|nr:hypothetical protein [Aquimarina algicola]TPN89098.1 hypothetical protein FHK87_02435 [Aquimarina algicola]
MKNDEIEKMFERLEGTYDIYEPSADHKNKFLDKLQQQHKVIPLHPKKKKNKFKYLAIAASFTLIIGISAFTFLMTPAETIDLANVSPQMEETQSFFTSAIEAQLEEINTISSPETKELVSDAMNQLQKLETDYEALKKDLYESGNDKRVISAMIKNFQKRANLLEEVLQKINEINKLKLLENENIIL